ncbi:MAG: glutaredoxin 3 [Proteobacteria bacterium]|nr:MAG: glutaredoxin 3 [Pseudomonadota bacterium]
MSAKVVIYTTRFCPFCIRARRLLKKKGIDYEEIGVANDPALWQKMQILSGRNTVPQIFINDQPIGGFDDMARLDRSGELDALLSTTQQ